jgi:hypothetical protein
LADQGAGRLVVAGPFPLLDELSGGHRTGNGARFFPPENTFCARTRNEQAVADTDIEARCLRLEQNSTFADVNIRPSVFDRFDSRFAFAFERDEVAVCGREKCGRGGRGYFVSFDKWPGGCRRRLHCDIVDNDGGGTGEGAYYARALLGENTGRQENTHRKYRPPGLHH